MKSEPLFILTATNATVVRARKAGAAVVVEAEHPGRTVSCEFRLETGGPGVLGRISLRSAEPCRIAEVRFPLVTLRLPFSGSGEFLNYGRRVASPPLAVPAMELVFAEKDGTKRPQMVPSVLHARWQLANGRTATIFACIAEGFKTNGYRTGVFGKRHNGDDPDTPEFQAAFKEAFKDMPNKKHSGGHGANAHGFDEAWIYYGGGADFFTRRAVQGGGPVSW